MRNPSELSVPARPDSITCMRQTHLGGQVVRDAPDPSSCDQCQDLLPRHEATEGPCHADVLVYAEKETKHCGYRGTRHQSVASR